MQTDTPSPDPLYTYASFDFRGETREYFRIWIVNIALTIVTLGIYSAWAKVRTNRYIYANTYLNDSNFEYLAKPERILVGRLIVAAFYGLFFLFSNYLGMQNVALGILGIALLLSPWLIRQAISFRLRNTSYRNIPFRYTGTTGQFYLFFGGYALVLVAIFLLFFVAPEFGFVGLLGLLLIYPRAYVDFKKLTIGLTRYGSGEFAFEGAIKPVYGIYFQLWGYNLILGLIIGLISGIGFYLSSFFGDMETLTHFLKNSVSPEIMTLAISAGVGLIYLPLVFANKGLSDALHGNYVRDNTLLGSGRFKGTFTPLTLAWIEASNIVVTLFSIGLLHPWAKMRSIRYKLKHTRFACGDYDQFLSSGYERGSALGEETMDFFDIDIGL
jgi:uncharacterized membrane protein YjgN (DUF898 family)